MHSAIKTYNNILEWGKFVLIGRDKPQNTDKISPEQWQKYFNELANTKTPGNFNHWNDVAEGVGISLENCITNNDRNKPFMNELLKYSLYGCKHLSTLIATIFNNIFKTGHHRDT